MKKSNFWNKIICFFLGHDDCRYDYVNKYRICLNRKGGKRRNAGVHIYRKKHYEIICLRCGKILKKK